MLWFYILIFIISGAILYLSGELLIRSLIRVSRFLGWREFVVAFFITAIAASLPNLFMGITSALQKIPELSFGDVVGGNIIDLTLAIALSVFFAKGREIPTQSRTVQTTLIFTIVAALLPLILILDGELSRIDGILLLGLFIFYLFWLFSKKERFTRIYDGEKASLTKEFLAFLKDLGKVILAIILLILASRGLVVSAKFFATYFNFSLALIGILIVGLGNALPETYFAIASARKGEGWMILGDLMGSVVVAATLVLGIVALISPIVTDFSPFIIARIFLIISAFFFLFFVRTDRKISQKEALFLLGLYILFIIIEIFNNIK